MNDGTGKNFSCNNAKGTRKPSDMYETPYSLTRQLLDREQLKGSILESASGNGAITKILQEYGYSYDEYDINKGVDFLEHQECDGRYETIITNPPFSLANEFVIHAKKLCNNIVFLLPWSYIHGKERFDTIYSDKEFPLDRVYCFTRYPMLGDKLEEGGRFRTGMMVFSWFIFTRGCMHEPIIRWIDNNEFVVGNKEARILGII
jgi:hypothetical protein